MSNIDSIKPVESIDYSSSLNNDQLPNKDITNNTITKEKLCNFKENLIVSLIEAGVPEDEVETTLEKIQEQNKR